MQYVAVDVISPQVLERAPQRLGDLHPKIGGRVVGQPVILAALPRGMGKRTVVAAATDSFYRNRLVAMLVSVVFNTVPLDRCGGGLDRSAAGHVDGLLDRGWNLLLYP